MATLYRKYRPQTFAEIAGQEHVKQILLEEVKSGRLAHAYLFSGPRGTGKTSMARLLAKALNCRKRLPNGEPCGECASCQEIAGSRSQDLIEIDAASNRRIDEMRQLREEVKYLPSRDQYRVYIIDEAHMLTTEAFNAFLKTLEEPPAHVVFILATTELAKISETVFSRCQHFAFSKLPFVKIMERLQWIVGKEDVKVGEDVLEEIVRRSGGALRDAESLLGQILGLGKKEITAEDAALFLPKVGFPKVRLWIDKLLTKDGAAALRELAALAEQGVNLEFFLDEALALGRQLLLYKITGDAKGLEWYFSQDEINDLTTLATNVDLNNIRLVVVNLLRASQDMRLSPELPILPIELAVVEICEEESNKEKGIRNKEKMENNPKNQLTIQPINYSTSDSNSIDVNNKRGNVNNHSLEDILAGWGEVLTRVKDRNHALNFILGVAEPVGVDGNTVELGFKYRLQQEKISEFKNREIIETVIEEVYGTRYRIRASVREDILPAKGEISVPPTDEEILVKTALEVFQGAVVEN